MTRLGGRLAIGLAAAALLTAGGVTASALQDAPRDARPSQDPIGDVLRGSPQPSTPVENAPVGQPAPLTPLPVTTPPPVVIVEEEAETVAPPVAKTAVAEKPIEQPEVPARRQRRKVVVIQAVNKVTAESMRFEVQVGGRPVRFARNLIFNVSACEVSTPDELTEDAVAYVDVSVQPRGTTQALPPRQVFKGWMFASSPAVSGLQHPNYDAWVVGCKD